MSSRSTASSMALLAALGLLAACWAPAPTTACVYLMGEAKDSEAHPAGTLWNYALRGDNWEGVDATNKSWVCLTGTKQSPLNLDSTLAPMGPPGINTIKTTWKFTPLKSNGSDIAVYNNGHTIQVQWTGNLKSDVTVWAKTKITDVLDATNAASGSLKPFKLTPLQFHFHTTSEHMIDGTFAPIEMHIVHSIPQSVLPDCPASGCLSVVGIMMHVDKNLTKGNAALQTLLNAAPEREGVMNYLPKGAVLDIEALMPPRNSRPYLQYEGSLTTPPCTEGLLWHVLKTPVYISLDQYKTYAKAVGLKECSEHGNGTEHESSRRRLHDHDHHHSDHAHHDHSSHLDVLSNENFVRGSYSGFVRGDGVRRSALATQAPKRLYRHRKLHSDDSDDDGTYECKVVAYGWTNRNVQPVGSRKVWSYQ